MMKLERSSMRNECNSRNGLRRDISIVVVVVRSRDVLLLLGSSLGRGLSAASPGLTCKIHPPSLLLHASSHEARL